VKTTKLVKLPWVLFAILLTLDTVSLIFDKMASNRSSSADETFEFYKLLAWQPWLWLSLAIAPLQLVTWTKILSKVDLSLAYSISSLHMPVTIVAAVVFLGEDLPLRAWVAGFLITLGVIILGGDHHEDQPGSEVQRP
jgi:drug/metabolite transporter (DMT)-like permease